MKKKLILSGIIDYTLILSLSLVLILSFVVILPGFSLNFSTGEIYTARNKLSAVVLFLAFAFVIGVGAFLAAVFKDLVFRNASIGKRILGLVILDRQFDIPTKKALIRRGYKMLSEGLAMIICELWCKGDFAEWELDNIGTRVIDKNHLENSKE